MKLFISLNGSIIASDDFRINPDNRGFRYGDGLFETMKVLHGQIRLESLHFERLFSSLDLLQFEIPSYFTHDYLREQVALLLKKNNHTSLARVRLMVYGGDGGIHDMVFNHPNLLIQSWPLAATGDPSPLRVGIFPDARKTCDLFSGIKSNNYLCYLMGALFAKKNGLNDALILNTYGRVAETTIANIFIDDNGIIKTPPLSEGCVNGVYRRFLLECFEENGIAFREEPVTVEMVQEADEVFTTNAIVGIRSVLRCGESIYGDRTARRLRNQCKTS